MPQPPQQTTPPSNALWSQCWQIFLPLLPAIASAGGSAGAVYTQTQNAGLSTAAFMGTVLTFNRLNANYLKQTYISVRKKIKTQQLSPFELLVACFASQPFSSIIKGNWETYTHPALGWIMAIPTFLVHTVYRANHTSAREAKSIDYVLIASLNVLTTAALQSSYLTPPALEEHSKPILTTLYLGLQYKLNLNSTTAWYNGAKHCIKKLGNNTLKPKTALYYTLPALAATLYIAVTALNTLPPTMGLLTGIILAGLITINLIDLLDESDQIKKDTHKHITKAHEL